MSFIIYFLWLFNFSHAHKFLPNCIWRHWAFFGLTFVSNLFLTFLPPLPLPLLAAGVVEGDLAAVEAYKSSGGDIARQLTADEVQLLNRSSAFDAGYTLVHLAIRFQRQDMLAILLTEVRHWKSSRFDETQKSN